MDHVLKYVLYPVLRTIYHAMRQMRPRLLGDKHPPAALSSQAVLSRKQLTLHTTRRTPHGASRLVLAISAWSLKARRTPSGQ